MFFHQTFLPPHPEYFCMLRRRRRKYCNDSVKYSSYSFHILYRRSGKYICLRTDLKPENAPSPFPHKASLSKRPVLPAFSAFFLLCIRAEKKDRIFLRQMPGNAVLRLILIFQLSLSVLFSGERLQPHLSQNGFPARISL